MNKISKNNPGLVDAVVDGILEKKGKDIRVLDLRKLESAVADYFIVCTGNSSTQVDALVDSVDEFAKKLTGENPISIEGRTNGEWVLMDYADVVVHIFLPETREFYKLEDLWSDADIQIIDNEK
jgi:ribosome-associated protein